MALHYAVRNKLLMEIRCLVESGDNVNVRDKDKRTPLMLCCAEDDEKFAAGIARMLLQAGAKVGLVDKDGRNSLMLAALFGRMQLTELFLKAVDFNLNKKDSFDNTALHFAALKGDVGATKKLLKAFSKLGGTLVNSRNRMGQTAAALALNQGHVACVDLFKNASATILFNTKVPSILLMRPWSADLKYIQNPELMLKEAMADVTVGVDIHRSRSDLNIHQFRRGSRVPEDRILKKRRKSASSSRQSYRSSSCLSCSPMNQHRSFISGDYDTNRFFLASRKTPGDSSWKDIVSDLMDILRVQVSESYRKTANVVPQTIEDVFRPPEPPKANQPDPDEINEKQTLSGGPENRRRSSTGLMRTKRSDVYDSSSSTENKRKNRRCSLQSTDVAPQLQRRKTLAKLA